MRRYMGECSRHNYASGTTGWLLACSMADWLFITSHLSSNFPVVSQSITLVAHSQIVQDRRCTPRTENSGVIANHATTANGEVFNNVCLLVKTINYWTIQDTIVTFSAHHAVFKNSNYSPSDCIPMWWGIASLSLMFWFFSLETFVCVILTRSGRVSRWSGDVAFPSIILFDF